MVDCVCTLQYLMFHRLFNTNIQGPGSKPLSLDALIMIL